jgi:hypothetical protein
MSGHPEPVVWDSASAAEREAWVTHVDACAECRARWLADDPSLMFALLAREPIPDAVLDAVSDTVAAEIRHDEKRPAANRFRAWPVAAALAAAALLLVAILVPWSGPGTESRDVGPVVELPIDDAAVPASLGLGVEVLSTPGRAQVVDLTVGEMQVVMIFDEEVDL